MRYIDEVMTFRTAHTFMTHRPGGAVMRARLQVHEALSKFQYAENDERAANTGGIGEVSASGVFEFRQLTVDDLCD